MELSTLVEICNQYREKILEKDGLLPNISVYRRNEPSDIEAYVYEPVVCLILQGSKIATIGNKTVRLFPGDALLVSHDLPVISRITEASADKPYLAVILTLDFRVIRSLYEQVAETHTPADGARSLCVAQAEPNWVGPLIRYLQLRGDPLDVRVLGPSVLREIHYRLLLSPIGKMLRNLLVADSHASRIAKAIEQMRAGFRTTLSVPDLARTAGMSSSSFHEHFKSVTGTTPLQYQKDLRLIEASALLAERKHSVSDAAYAVGYESPTQFSREYRRKFGVPPSRHIGADAGLLG